MPAAAASALRPMATRTPLMAMTAVQALCRMAKRIPDQPNSWRRERSESAESRGTSLRAEFSVLAICSGTEIECSEVRNLRPIGSRIREAKIFWRVWRVAARRLGHAREGGLDLRYKCRSDWIRRFQFGRPRLRENGLCRASGASLLLLARAL